MEQAMDNKYGLGSTKVATEHHELHHHSDAESRIICKFCQSENVTLSPTMHDHKCSDCGEWQLDIPQGYSTGRSSDY
jgi:hypothetical protein